MTRRKLAIVGIVLGAAAIVAGVVAIVLRGPSMRSRFEQLRDGMTYDECVAILGKPDVVGRLPFGDPPRGKQAIWARRDWAIHITFDANQERVGLKWFTESRSGFFDRVLSWFGL